MSRPANRITGHLTGLTPAAATNPNELPLITTIIPTTANSPTLDSVIAAINRQTQPTNIIIVDTGSAIEDYQNLEERMAQLDNVQLIRIAPQNWSHQSQPVATALDLATAITQTPFIFLTHDDVWIKNQNLLKELITRHLITGSPVIGYEMSSRSHLTEQWRGMVSHTATLLVTKRIRELNLRWSLLDALKMPECENHGPGWPDTETAFGLRMKQLNLTPHFIGHETNEPHFEDDHLVHRRSLTSHRLLNPQLATTDLDWQTTQIKNFETK